MKRTALVLTFLIAIINISSQDFRFAAALIADSLKQNANAVVRDHHQKLKVLHPTKVQSSEYNVITVLNENGRKLAWKSFPYDKDKKILKVLVKVYNELGIHVSTWHHKDLEDISADPYGTTFSDTRYLVSKPIRDDYPYTVEYFVSYEENNTYTFNRWFPVWSDNLSVERSSFSLIYPESIEFSFKENLVSLASNEKSFDVNTLNWTLENIKAIKYEPFRPFKEEYLPNVRVSPKRFSYAGFEGNTNTWKEFGAFRIELLKGRNNLPMERIQQINSIVETCSTQKSKVIALYKYMQSHTRYFNISEGIGGIQPIPAEIVSENGYGDCKALSNYMLSILKVAGIKSYYGVLKAGDYNYYFDHELVGHQSNHVILNVPLEKDTIWLECTSQSLPAGFLGSFTDNRDVLLITENGGVLQKTPKYTQEENRIDRTAYVKLNEMGDGSAKIVSKYTGLEYDNKHRISIKEREEQLKMLYKDIDIPNFKILEFEIESSGNIHPKLVEKVQLDLIKYASKSGSRIFLPINLASKWDFVPKELGQRKFDIQMVYSSSYYDSLVYELPENYTVEALPEFREIENKYGTYSAEIEVNGNNLFYRRTLKINEGIFPADEYKDYILFFNEIITNDESMVVLKKHSL